MKDCEKNLTLEFDFEIQLRPPLSSPYETKSALLHIIIEKTNMLIRRKMVYLDNASTTHKKPRCVINAVRKGLTRLSVNSGRGAYKLAIKASEEVYNTRVRISNFLNNDDPSNIIFTGSCTQAINMALRGSVKLNGHIITTTFEHNSVLRTLNYLKHKYNISYTIVSPKSPKLTRDDILKHIRPETYLVAVNHTSNVVGVTQDLKMIGDVCKSKKLLLFVDGAQSVGHTKIDMQKYNINMLTVAGHKGVFAPQGIGVLALNNIKINPLIMGGTGTFSESIEQPNDPPEAFESGTQSMANILGVNAGFAYLERKFDKISTKTKKLSQYLYDNLILINKVKVYSERENNGVISFNIDGMTSSDVSNILSEKYNICTRSGLHCAPLVHKYFGTINRGMVRVSLSYFNSYRDITKFLKAIKVITTT